jgi:hypothetical protein
MRIVDHSADVRDLILTGLAAVERALPRFRNPRSVSSDYLQDSASDLLALLTEIYQLRRFARLGAPHIDDIGGFGTGLDDSDAPTVMSVAEGKESWDFQPWLAEKLQAAERLVFKVCDICALDGDAMPRPRWRRVGRYDDPGAECSRLLEGVRAYLTAMLGLLESGELKIRQLSTDDADHGDDDE